MTNVETSSQDDILTGASATGTQESNTTTSEPTEEEKLPEDSKNWQHALQQAREREKAKEEEARKYQEELKQYKKREEARELEGMTEADKYKAIAESEAQKRAMLELRTFVNETIAGKNIPAPIIELLRENPMAIPPVARELGDEYAWDDAISSVQRHLPDYVNSLVVENPSEKEPIKRVDSERSYDTSGVSMGHTYTREEIQRISADPKEWEKHRERILNQLGKAGGRISE